MQPMMILGGFTFGLLTAAPQDFSRDKEWRWPAQDIFGGEQALQFTGWGADTITLAGVVYPEFMGGTGQLDALRAIGNSGQPQTLINGRGIVLGQYVVEKVSERGTVFAAAGVALRQEFTMTLKRYGVVASAASAAGGILGAVVSAATGGAAIPGIVAGASALGGGMMASLSGALGAVQGVVSSVVAPMAGALGAIGQGIGAARSLTSAVRDIKATGLDLSNISSLTGAQSALGGIMRTASNVVQTATRASGTLSGTMDSLIATAAPAGAIQAVQGAFLQVNRLAVGATQVRAKAEDAVRSFDT